MWNNKRPGILEYLTYLLIFLYDSLPCWHRTQFIAKPSWKGFPDQPECEYERYCVRCRRIVGCRCGMCPSSFR